MKTEKGIRKKLSVSAIILSNLILLIFVLFSSFIVYFEKLEKSNEVIYLGYLESPVRPVLGINERVEDFLYMYEKLKSGCPSAYIKVNGRSFIDRKDEFLEIIRKTESDYEFKVVMEGILASVPGFHTFMPNTDFENMINISSCYCSEFALSKEEIASKLAYWNDIIAVGDSDFDESYAVQYAYDNGAYIYLPENDNLTDDFIGSELILVNGIPVDEYAVNVISVFPLRYDTGNEKWKRKRFTFNNKYGEPVSLVVEKRNKERITINCFYDVTFERDFSVNKSNKASEIVYDSGKSYSVYAKEKICYVNTTGFYSNDIRGLKSALEQYEFTDLILDLRDNTGGMMEYASESLYPILYSDDSEFKATAYIKRSSDLNKISNISFLVNYFTSGLSFCDSELGGVYYRMERIFKFTGGNSISYDNLYVLIGENTGSASDIFASALKGKTKTILIGETAAGESSGSSYCLDSMPNSGLLFAYFPTYAQNADGTDNSVHGTVPDIYSYQSVQGYIKKQELLDKKIDLFTLENRLLWDDVLIETLELIKEKGNVE